MIAYCSLSNPTIQNQKQQRQIIWTMRVHRLIPALAFSRIQIHKIGSPTMPLLKLAFLQYLAQMFLE